MDLHQPTTTMESKSFFLVVQMNGTYDLPENESHVNL